MYRAYFGPARYDALRRRTLGQRGASRAAKRGNVVILHGVMGGELTVRDDGDDKQIWMSVWRLALGGLDRLRMKDGNSLFDVRATGILKKWYAEQIMEFSYDWNTQTYWYDWRRDLDETADDLRAKIDGWFGADAAVNLVAHSMGGLVSRTYISRHEKRWARGGKLVMLGTPNHGSFTIPQVITGALDTVRKIALVDLKHNLAEVTEILAGLPGVLQMLPSPLVMPAMAPLYQSSTWGGRVPQALLDRARRHHDLLAGVVDGERMRYIAGSNRVTHDDIRDWKRLDALDGYSTSMNGDGTVPHRLGFIEHDGARIPTWFVQEDHGALANNTRAITASQMLLLGDTCDLSKTPEGARSVAADRSAARTAAAGEQARRMADEARLTEIVARMAPQSRSAKQAAEAPISQDEIEGAQILMRGFLSESTTTGEPSPVEGRGTKGRKKPAPAAPPKIQIALLLTDLAKLPPSPRGVPPVDAISVGHYVGVAPQYAELALDRAISGWSWGDPEEKLVITAMHRRGTIAARLGQQCIVPFPAHPERLAVLAGMGEPGSFRIPELTIAVQELVWAMGRMGRKHLASVLIGAGVGNMTIQLAVRAWLRAVRRALVDADATRSPRIERLTFVEFSAVNFVRMHRALEKESELICKGRDDERLLVEYLAPDAAVLNAAKTKAEEMMVSHARNSIQSELTGESHDTVLDPDPVRFTVSLKDRTYEFSVMSSEASVPQRDTTVDPKLIAEINDELPTAPSFRRQRDLGNLLGRLLVPADLQRTIVQPGIPTVLAVDATTARIHFEMAALSPSGGDEKFAPEEFMGPAASLTRQLRTSFAPLPEPPMMAGKPLRVLVIADPCEESPLPGAQEEGEAVARLFEQFKAAEEAKDAGARVDVVRLFGPSEATRVAVLDHLINQRFDILHYAGHCFFNEKDPPRSGWLFSRDQVLSAYELGRIDRVPRFVFSNACESGITPDRAGQRSAGLAPSFAEAFFGRGVTNLK